MFHLDHKKDSWKPFEIVSITTKFPHGLAVTLGTPALAPFVRDALAAIFTHLGPAGLAKFPFGSPIWLRPPALAHYL